MIKLHIKDSITQKIKEHMQKVINDFNTNKNKRNYKKSLESMIIKIKLLLGENKNKIIIRRKKSIN